jgi:hypothetical protein
MLERNATLAQLEEPAEGQRQSPSASGSEDWRRRAPLKHLAQVGNEGRSTDAEGDEDTQKNFCPKICTQPA